MRLATLAGGLVAVGLVFAVDAVAAGKAPHPASIPAVVDNLRNWIVGILAGLATLFLTLGGLRYLMAGGDASEVEAAKKALKASGSGYGLAILAPVIVEVLKGILGI
ncbi:pilin [Streptomyces smyrnaeus]|uniref:pilin n=1 Tax=Streptomyces smyrnaeus TaxID=1387713 RepID=UPI0036C02407